MSGGEAWTQSSEEGGYSSGPPTLFEDLPFVAFIMAFYAAIGGYVVFVILQAVLQKVGPTSIQEKLWTETNCPTISQWGDVNNSTWTNTSDLGCTQRVREGWEAILVPNMLFVVVAAILFTLGMVWHLLDQHRRVQTYRKLNP